MELSTHLLSCSSPERITVRIIRHEVVDERKTQIKEHNIRLRRRILAGRVGRETDESMLQLLPENLRAGSSSHLRNEVLLDEWIARSLMHLSEGSDVDSVQVQIAYKFLCVQHNDLEILQKAEHLFRV